MNATPIMSPIHPGEVLLQEYLEPLGVTQHRLAVAIGVPPRRINEIVHGKRRISADTALRLARYLGTGDPPASFVRIGSTSGTGGCRLLSLLLQSSELRSTDRSDHEIAIKG
jgi:addiction module HigA family antidote